MAKPELGTKRICASCGAKYYDLAREPIVCPKCGTVYQAVTSARAAAPAAAARAAAAAAAAAQPRPTEEVELPQPANAEVISLEDADAEATGSKKKVAGAEGEEEEVEIATTEEDNTTFLEQDEEEVGDVSDIIGEGIEEKEEET